MVEIIVDMFNILNQGRESGSAWFCLPGSGSGSAIFMRIRIQAPKNAGKGPDFSWFWCFYLLNFFFNFFFCFYFFYSFFLKIEEFWFWELKISRNLLGSWSGSGSTFFLSWIWIRKIFIWILTPVLNIKLF